MPSTPEKLTKYEKVGAFVYFDEARFSLFFSLTNIGHDLCIHWNVKRQHVAFYVAFLILGVLATYLGISYEHFRCMKFLF